MVAPGCSHSVGRWAKGLACRAGSTSRCLGFRISSFAHVFPYGLHPETSVEGVAAIVSPFEVSSPELQASRTRPYIPPHSPSPSLAMQAVNVGIVALPVTRLGVLAGLASLQRDVSTTMKVADVPCLVMGASKGEVRGLGGLRGVGSHTWNPLRSHVAEVARKAEEAAPHSNSASMQGRRLMSSSGGAGGATMDVFDEKLKALQRERLLPPPSGSEEGPGGGAATTAAGVVLGDPLVEQVVEILLDRLEDCRRSFASALVVGGAFGDVVTQLGGRGGISQVLAVDRSPALLKAAETHFRCQRLPFELSFAAWDHDSVLPVEPGAFDVVIACLGLHWLNDLPGALLQCRLALKPDGLFLGAMLGGDTLQEMRIACTLAHMEREGGVSARISPLAQVRDAGNLLTRAGFSLTTVDVDTFTIGYRSAVEAVEHLRCLRETNATKQHSRALSRDTALAAAAVYHHMFPSSGGLLAGDPADVPTAGVAGSFQVIFLSGWAPHDSQQLSKPRGSASVTLDQLHDLVKRHSPKEEGG